MDKKEKVVLLRKKGYSYNEIQKKFDIKKEKVVLLRKKGYSYNEIQKKFDIPKSTLSYWLKDLKLSKQAEERLKRNKYNKSTLKLIERNKRQTEVANEKYQLLIKEGIKEFQKHKDDSLFLSGVSLYWAEGYKKGAKGSKWKVVDFTNSDEQMIVLMMKFFRKYFNIQNCKFRIQLIAHPNVNIEKAISKWASLTNIPKDQFIKTFSKQPISSKGKRNKKSLPIGTAHIRIYDVNQFFRLIGWIEGLKKYLKV